jgi:hypothetical protein
VFIECCPYDVTPVFYFIGLKKRVLQLMRAETVSVKIRERRQQKERDEHARRLWDQSRTPELRKLLVERYPHLFAGRPIL